MDNKKGELMMYFDEKRVLEAAHQAIERVIRYADKETPEDYGLERIRGIYMLTEMLLHPEKEGDS
jgi:hypothetical protein